MHEAPSCFHAASTTHSELLLSQHLASASSSPHDQKRQSSGPHAMFHPGFNTSTQRVLWSSH